MCLVSDKIKFCTCISKNHETLKHYWLLYRHDKNKDVFILGDPIMPTSMRDPNFEINQSTLLVRLNEPDAFDVPLQSQTKDKLVITINCQSGEMDNLFTYAFAYKNGKWITSKDDPFDLINNYNEKAFGKLKLPIRRNNVYTGVNQKAKVQKDSDI
jgi:hypothetical protein